MPTKQTTNHIAGIRISNETRAKVKFVDDLIAGLSTVFAQVTDNLPSTTDAETMQIIAERDLADTAFTDVVALLGIETEFSNLRDYKEIISDVATRIDELKQYEHKYRCAVHELKILRQSLATTIETLTAQDDAE